MGLLSLFRRKAKPPTFLVRFIGGPLDGVFDEVTRDHLETDEHNVYCEVDVTLRVRYRFGAPPGETWCEGKRRKFWPGRFVKEKP